MKTSESKDPSLSALIQSFFTQRLIQQRNASSQTVASYRDTFKLLLVFIQTQTGKNPIHLRLEDFNAPLILSFLEHLESERHNTIRTRNLRLTAIRSFLNYAALLAPASLSTIQRALAIPSKRHSKPLLGFLTREEIDAILLTPDVSTWSGARDRVLLNMLYNTGGRVSEIVGLRVCDLFLDHNKCVKILGKGRKERMVPIWKSTVAELKEWLPRISSTPGSPLCPNRRGEKMTRSGVEQRLRVAVEAAVPKCPSLEKKRISPHTIRHTTAMHLLQSGVDISVIALWLGHESPATTHQYIEADLAMKEHALNQLSQPAAAETRYRAKDDLLAFLEGL